MVDRQKDQDAEESCFLPQDVSTSGTPASAESKTMPAAHWAHLVSPANLFENPARMPPPPPKEKKRQWSFRWGWEVASLAVSLIALMAIMILIHAYDGKSLKVWQGPITINAVIAVLSAIFRGLLVVPLCRGIAQLKWVSFANKKQSFANLDTYDQASRGAWGSIILLKRQLTGQRLSPIAILGAVLAILLLITEPFSQAAVNLAMCERVDVGQASIPRFSIFADAVKYSVGPSEMTQGFEAAIYQGLYDYYRNTSQLMQPSVNCPTGNCTFPQPTSLQSISMCHSCRDISSKVQASNDIQNRPTTIEGYPSNYTVGSVTLSGIVGYPVAFALNTSTCKAARWPDGPWFDTSISSFQGIGTAYKNSSCTKDVTCASSYFAFDCALRPCVRSYSSIMENGKYSERETKVEYLHPGRSGSFELAVNETFINGTWTKCSPEKQKTGTHYSPVYLPFKVNDYGSPMKEPETVWYPPDCVYLFNAGDVGAVSDMLNNLFAPGYLVWRNGNAIGTTWVKDLWNHGAPNMDIANRFAEGIANAMGVYMRTHGKTQRYFMNDDDTSRTEDIPADNLEASGDAHRLEPCIQARWRFLSFLVVLFALEVVFFLAVIWVDRKSRI